MNRGMGSLASEKKFFRFISHDPFLPARVFSSVSATILKPFRRYRWTVVTMSRPKSSARIVALPYPSMT